MRKGFLLFSLLLMTCAVHAQQHTITYVYTDSQGTPLAEADAQGNITATFDYAPYGSQALGTAPNGPGYTGHVNDPDTGLIYMQARYYDPASGRFLSTDPVGPSAGNLYGFNRYAYANNNPIVNIDPDGRNITEALGGVFYEAASFVTGNGFHDSQIVGAMKDGYNGEGGGVVHAALEDIGTISAVAGTVGVIKGGGALITRLAAKEVVEEGAELANGATKSLKDQASGLVAKNGGKNRVTMRSPSQKVETDLAGKSHGGIETPHTKISERNVNAPNQPAYNTKSATVQPSTQQDIRTARRYLEKDH